MGRVSEIVKVCMGNYLKINIVESSLQLTGGAVLCLLSVAAAPGAGAVVAAVSFAAKVCDRAPTMAPVYDRLRVLFVLAPPLVMPTAPAGGAEEAGAGRFSAVVAIEYIKPQLL